MSNERAAVLPSLGLAIKLSADSYEQHINQTLPSVEAAHQQAVATVTDKEKVQLGQQQQHWQLESQRRLSHRGLALTALHQALAKYAITLGQLTELLAYDEAWLLAENTRMQSLERALQEAVALVQVQGQACLQHEQHQIAISEADAVQTALQLQQHKQSVSLQKEGQALLLREDDQRIAANRHLKTEWEAQQARWQQWASLNELIGSSTGSKFRVFAQSLTLEALLAHSNQHLEDFAKRYHLQRVPGSDLELQIIDKDMADDVRSVHSLSGGESFLVSLALGLASLSSNKTQVESLFIDEVSRHLGHCQFRHPASLGQKSGCYSVFNIC